MASSDPELLSQSAARQLLERAGQIDSESLSLEHLRAAAREAGISEAAFEAALAEMRGRAAQPPARVRNVTGRRLTLVAATVMLFGAIALIAGRMLVSGADVPREVARLPVVEARVHVRCISVEQAQRLARPILDRPGNELVVDPVTGILRIRGTPQQIQRVQSLLDRAASDVKSCATPAVPPP